MKKNSPQKNSLHELKDHFWWFFLSAFAVWMGWVVFTLNSKSPLQSSVLFSVIPNALPSFSITFFYFKNLFYFIGILMTAQVAGFYLLKRFNINWSGALERFVFEIAWGYASLSLLLLLFAACHILLPVSIAITWTIGVCLYLYTFFKKAEFSMHCKESYRQVGDYFSFWKDETAAKIALWIFLLFCILISLAPDLFYDSLVYHLGAPNAYLASGKLLHLGGSNTRFPMLWQMLYSFGLGMSDEILCKWIHLSSGILILLGLQSLSQRLKCASWVGIVAGLFFFSTPMVQMNIWTAGIDIGATLFAFLGGYALFIVMEHATVKPMIFFAATASFAYGSKYQGGVVTIALFLTWLIGTLWQEPKRWKEIFRLSILFWSVFTVLISPWMIKNIWDVGNPFYPFLSDLFTKIGWERIPMEADQMKVLIGENRRFITSSWQELWRLPWLFAFNDKNQSSLSYVGAMFFLFLPAVFLPLKDWKEKKWLRPLVIFLALFFAASISSTHLTRYHLGGYPLLCFFFALGVYFIWARVQALYQLGIACAIAFVLLNNFQVGAFIFSYSYKAWDVILGRESRAEYRMYTHSGLNPYPSNKMYRWMEANLPKDSLTLIVGDSKPYDLKLPHLYTDVFNRSRIVLYSRLGSSEKIYAAFQKEKISYLFINFIEAYRTWSYHMLDFTEEEIKNFDAFWKDHVRLVHAEIIPEKFFDNRNPLLLFAILSKEEATQAGPPPENPIQILYDTYNKKNP